MNEQDLRRHFETLHRHPELAFEETETTRYIKKVLAQEGIETLDTGMPTGVIAVIRGGLPGPAAGLRSDIDALPVQEESGLPYSSEVPGRMHACGHDFHPAALLGAASLLQARRAELHGTVKIIFQPAEEIASGARKVVETGQLADCRAIFGIHTYPEFQPGTLGIKPGPVMAAPDRFSLTLKGKGTHGAEPDRGLDPIPAMAAVIQGFQTLITRRVNAFDAAVISVTHAEAGNTWNVVPETALLEGTVRTLNPEIRERIRLEMGRMAERIAEAWGLEAEWTYWKGPDPVWNDADLAAFAEGVAREMGFQTAHQKNTMGGEDFSEYAKICPVLFIRIGTGGLHPAHHPGFTADPAALWPAAQFCARLAEEWLRKEG